MKYGIKYIQKDKFSCSIKTDRGYEDWIKTNGAILSNEPPLLFHDLNSAFIEKQNRYDYDTENYYYIVEEFIK